MTTTFGREANRNNGVNFSNGLFGRVRTYMERSRAERQLRQMDDRMLADIGLYRGDIEKMVWGS